MQDSVEIQNTNTKTPSLFAEWVNYAKVNRHPGEQPSMYAYVKYTILCLSHLAIPYLSYISYTNPFEFVFHNLVVWYYHQYMFLATHLSLHVLFTSTPESFINIPWYTPFGNYNAFYHHYVQPSYFTDCWLQYRNGYFNIPLSVPALMGPLMLAQYTGAPEYKIMKVVTMYLIFLFWTHTEALVHEWYHVRISKRKQYFNIAPVNWYLRGLEAIGLINSEEHKLHHESDAQGLKDTHSFFDMEISTFWKNFGDSFWAWMLKVSNTSEKMHTQLKYDKGYIDPLLKDSILNNTLLFMQIHPYFLHGLYQKSDRFNLIKLWIMCAMITGIFIHFGMSYLLLLNF